MNIIEAIKPWPKPKKPDGTPDERRRVTPETRPKHPDLKPHKHRPGDSKWITDPCKELKIWIKKPGC